ncbi:sulfotransferase domain-containing protein [Neolewinella aurantiaca]|uniref:sulfotransferase domain-containing protein n=1 Tax=Neolewinella aurantiaca TaxID=2602767 RepID=UPI00164F8FEC|nr:sulfotransferase domain-containing protein [Neolewinella aurantiaca]
MTESLHRTHVTRDAHKRQPLAAYLTGETKVVHGHFHYEEIAEVKQAHDAKVICWLRDPVERVISNYHFFENGLTDPARNKKNYELNKHRKHESLLTYATMPEKNNVMSKLLTGIDLADIFFIGFTEDYENDLSRLSNLLGWPEVTPAHLNTRRAPEGPTEEVTAEVRAEIARLNAGDVALYRRALELKENAR